MDKVNCGYTSPHNISVDNTELLIIAYCKSVHIVQSPQNGNKRKEYYGFLADWESSEGF